MSVWVVRAGRDGDQEQYALQNNLAVIGWDDVPDLSSLNSRDQLLPLLVRCYPDEGENTLKNWETQLWAFSHRIVPADLVILPRKRSSTVAFGSVTGMYSYKSNGPAGCAHRIPVKWLRTDISRQLIDPDLRFSIGGAMTVFQVTRNNAEERFRALVEDPSAMSAARLEDRANSDLGAGESVAPDLAQLALDQIADHIGRKFRGHELERLVEAVLRAQGLATNRTNPGADGGVDILCGRGSLGLDPPRLCVQVKSQDQAVDVKVIRELQGSLRTFGADVGLVVSWGGFTSAAEAEARRQFFQIRLWDADELIRQIEVVYDELGGDIQKDLPMQRVWTLVNG